MLSHSLATILRTIITIAILYLPVAWLLTSLTRYRNARARGCLPPPSLPQKDPIFGLDLVLDFFKQMKQHSILKDIQATINKYGTTYSSSPFGRRTVQTIEPQNIQSVFATDIESYEIGITRGRSILPLLGEGIMGAEGKNWKASRSLMNPTFARSDIDLENFGKQVEIFMGKLPKDGSTVNLAPMFAELILDASSQFVFGESVGSQISDSEEHKDFLKWFDIGKSGIAARFFLAKMDILYQSQTFRNACKSVHDWTQRRVDKAYRRLSEDEKGTKHYILAHELASQLHDSAKIRGELLNVYFAGHDSPAIALTSIMFEIARHPDVWLRVRKEVQDLGDAELTFENLKSLKYIQWVTNETLRLHPVVPANSRFCTRPTTLPVGGGPSGAAAVYMHPGDKIQMNFYTLHRSSRYFGEDADLFRPERWQDLRTTWEFLPFGGGPRTCPAQQLSRVWIAYVLVVLARKVKALVNRDEVCQFVEVTRLSLESGNGAKVGFVWE